MNFKKAVMLVLLIFLPISNAFGLMQSIISKPLIEIESTELYIDQEDPAHIVIGPYFGYYFESRNKGNTFSLKSEFPDKDNFILLTEQKESTVYRLEKKKAYIDLYVSEDNGASWTATNLSVLTGTIQSIYEYDKNKISYTPYLVRSNNMLYYGSILIALIISFIFAYLLKKALNTKITTRMILETTVFYIVILLIPALIVPKFAEMFLEMEIQLPLITIFYCIVGTSSMAVFVYTLAFTALSPIVIRQIEHAIRISSKNSTLKAKPSFAINLVNIFFIMAIILSFTIGFFLPLIK